MRRLALALGLIAILAPIGCQAASRPVEMTDPRVSAGPARTCAELGLSDVRCTLLTLRAARELEEARPGAEAVSRQLHEAGEPPAGQSPIPRSQVVAVVVVFTLADGSRVGIPLLCPRRPSGADRACDPRIH